MKTLLRSEELSCPSCVAKIEKALRGLDGVATAVVHFGSGKIEVEHDPLRATTQELMETVRRSGYEAYLARV